MGLSDKKHTIEDIIERNHLKNVPVQIKNELAEKECLREESYREEDTDDECKDGKKVFQVTMTNNSTSQQNINLFDNFDLTQAQFLTNPVNTFLSNLAANSSNHRFIEWLVNGQGYTIGGLLADTVVRYDSSLSFVNEFVLPAAATNFTLSNKFNTFYSSIGTFIYTYSLGTGLPVTAFAQVIAPDGLAADDVNDFLWVLRTGSATIRRLDQNALGSSTTFALPAVPNVSELVYFSAANEVVVNIGTSIHSVNPITGVSTLRQTFSAGFTVIEFVDMPTLGLFGFVYSDVGGFGVRILDMNYNVLGTYTTATSLGSIVFDSSRGEIIVNEIIGAMRTLFFTVTSIAASTFSSSYPFGISTDILGYLSQSQTILYGFTTTVPVYSLSRKPTIEISNQNGYDFFTESLGEEPILTSCMDVISTTQSQLVNNIIIQHKDSDGNVQSKPRSPIIKVDTNQEQGSRAFLGFKNLIFDGTTTIPTYPINASETVTFVLYYEQFKRASLLSDSIVRKTHVQQPYPIIDYAEADKRLAKDRRECNENSSVIEITVTNTTGTDSFFNFFQANEALLIVNQPTAQFTNVEDYNILTQELRQNPLVLCGMDVLGATQEQLVQTIIINTKDADGNRFSYQHFPVNYINTDQFSGNRSFIKTNHLILDGYTTFPLYKILANSTVTFVLYYRQYFRAKLLQDSVFPVLRKPLTDNGSEVGEDIEYYNDITEAADNTYTVPKYLKKDRPKPMDKTEKSLIFEAEQVYSDGLRKNRPDFLVPFYNKVNVKYAEIKGDCTIPKPDLQIIYVDTHDLEFGKEVYFPNMPLSEQDFTQEHLVDELYMDLDYFQANRDKINLGDKIVRRTRV